MPRVTYATRLADLAAKPLSDYDRGFVESLTQYYQRKRSMTAGRRAAIERLEERYSDESLAAAAANPLTERLAVLADRVDPGTDPDPGSNHLLRSQDHRDGGRAGVLLALVDPAHDGILRRRNYQHTVHHFGRRVIRLRSV